MEINRKPVDLMIAPATLSSDALTLVWDKPEQYGEVKGYRIYQNKSIIGETNKTHLSVKSLSANTEYEFYIEAVYENGIDNVPSDKIIIKTEATKEIIDVTKPPYCADRNGVHISTAEIQKAIEDCKKGGIVLIPQGAIIHTGALELKSNMTMQIDGTLKGSLNPEDYILNEELKKKYMGQVNGDGLILTRYEGWEMYCYRSLINAGYLNPNNRMEMTCENIRICGEGVIYGGGNELGTAMKKLYEDKEKYPEYVSDGIGGRRIRGRLLSFIQCKNVHLTGISAQNPPCWTIHMIYCDTVTTNGISIKSRGIDNGDGWDPDSSRNMMIFDTNFDTGDDCIAIKSGKNPEGNQINIPTSNVRIFDLQMLGGHGMAIGSELSGGVEEIYLRDCVIQNTMYGLELKAHSSRGGYIKGVRMLDCEIDRFMAHSVTYNADGKAAPELPYFRDIVIKNTTISSDNKAVELVGFQDGKNSKANYVQRVLLENVVLDGNNEESKKIFLEACNDITFKNVKLSDGKNPVYILDEKTVFSCRK